MVIGMGVLVVVVVAAAWDAGVLYCDYDCRYGGAGLGWLCRGFFYTGFCCASPSSVVVRSEGVWLLVPLLVNDGGGGGG